MKGDLHVIPMRDLRAHDDQTRACWCGPDVITVNEDTGQPFAGGRAVVIHRSADGREHVERHGVQ
jgi:hypothetical protein